MAAAARNLYLTSVDDNWRTIGVKYMTLRIDVDLERTKFLININVVCSSLQTWQNERSRTYVDILM
jgi:hypothetical protein